jgi:hypothetical protein
MQMQMKSWCVVFVLAIAAALSVSHALGQVTPAKNALYVSNFNTNTITAYDAVTGALLGTVVTAGPELSGMNGFAIAPDGGFYVAGQNTNNIVHYSKSGKLIKVLDPNNTAGLASPQGVNFGPDGLLYVASMNNGKIVRFDTTNETFKDIFTNVTLTGVKQSQPIEPRFDRDGNLVVTTFQGGRVLKYQGPVVPPGSLASKSTTPPGTLILVFQLPPSASVSDTDVAYASGDTLEEYEESEIANSGSATGVESVSGTAKRRNRWVVDAINPTTLVGEVQEYMDDGTFVSFVVPNGRGGLVLTGGIAIGPDKKLYLANVRVDQNFNDIGSEILRFDPISGKFLGIFVPSGQGLSVPFSIRFGPR